MSQEGWRDHSPVVTPEEMASDEDPVFLSNALASRAASCIERKSASLVSAEICGPSRAASPTASKEDIAPLLEVLAAKASSDIERESASLVSAKVLETPPAAPPVALGGVDLVCGTNLGLAGQAAGSPSTGHDSGPAGLHPPAPARASPSPAGAGTVVHDARHLGGPSDESARA